MSSRGNFDRSKSIQGPKIGLGPCFHDFSESQYWGIFWCPKCEYLTVKISIFSNFSIFSKTPIYTHIPPNRGRKIRFGGQENLKVPKNGSKHKFGQNHKNDPNPENHYFCDFEHPISLAMFNEKRSFLIWKQIQVRSLPCFRVELLRLNIRRFMTTSKWHKMTLWVLPFEKWSKQNFSKNAQKCPK